MPMNLHLQRFLQAASFLIGYPREMEEVDDYTGVLPYFALVGATLGVASALVVLIFGALLSSIGKAVFGALALTTFWIVLSRAQNLLSLPVLWRVWRASVAPATPPPAPDNAAPQAGVLLMFGAIVIKVACIGILVYVHQWRWLMVAPLLSVLFTVEMAIAHGFFHSRREDFLRSRQIFLALVFVVALIFAGPRGLFAGLFIWLAIFFLSQWSVRAFGAAREEWINGGAEAVECVVLLLGLALFT